MTPTPHGQVPEALRLAHIFDNPLPPEWPDMIAAAAELRRQHTRIAELEAQIEALSGVQALSAAPAVPAAWKAVPVNPTPEMWKAAKSVPRQNPYGLVWDAMLAASPTPPALSAAPAIGDELRDTLVAVSAAIAEQDDRAAQKMIREILAATPTPTAEQQAAPKAAPAEQEEAAQRLRKTLDIDPGDVNDPLHPRYIAGFKSGHAAGRRRAADEKGQLK